LEIKKLQKIHNFGGDIFVFEGERFDFQIRRIYFTKNVEVGEVRGHHAHKSLEQILVCPYGEMEITLDDGKGRKETTVLCDPDDAVYVGPSTWRTMKWLKPGSILLVFASQPYDESDYIRDYDVFRNFAAGK